VIPYLIPAKFARRKFSVTRAFSKVKTLGRLLRFHRRRGAEREKMLRFESSRRPSRRRHEVHLIGPAEQFIQAAGFHDAVENITLIGLDPNFDTAPEGDLSQDQGGPFSDCFEVAYDLFSMAAGDGYEFRAQIGVGGKAFLHTE